MLKARGLHNGGSWQALKKLFFTEHSWSSSWGPVPPAGSGRGGRGQTGLLAARGQALIPTEPGSTRAASIVGEGPLHLE